MCAVSLNDIRQILTKESIRQFLSLASEFDVPHRLHDGLMYYVIYGTRPGGFLNACLENDLQKAVARCDDPTLESLRLVTRFIWNVVPEQCWGSAEKVESWIANVGKRSANMVGDTMAMRAGGPPT